MAEFRATRERAESGVLLSPVLISGSVHRHADGGALDQVVAACSQAALEAAAPFPVLLTICLDEAAMKVRPPAAKRVVETTALGAGECVGLKRDALWIWSQHGRAEEVDSDLRCERDVLATGITPEIAFLE